MIMWTCLSTAIALYAPTSTVHYSLLCFANPYSTKQTKFWKAPFF